MLDKIVVLLVVILIIFLVIVLIIKQGTKTGSAYPKKINFSLNDDIGEYTIEKFLEIYDEEFDMIYNGKQIKFAIIYDNYQRCAKITHVPKGEHVGLTIKIDCITNSSEITKVHSTKEFRGFEMVALALDICRKLGINTTTLHDAACYECDGRYDMMCSFVKMLKEKKTYYMAAGFDFMNIKTKNNAEKLVDKIREIKTDDIKKYYIQTLDMLTKCKKICECDGNCKFNCINIKSIVVKEYKNILNILNSPKSSEFVYYYELLIYLFKHDCKNYIIIQRHVFGYEKIKIDDKKFINDYVKLLEELHMCLLTVYYYIYPQAEPNKKIFYLSDGNPFTDNVSINLANFIKKYGNDLYLCYNCELMPLKLVNDIADIANIAAGNNKLIIMKLYNNGFKIDSSSSKSVKINRLAEAINIKFNVKLDN